MDLNTYLINKKIDPEQLLLQESERYHQFKSLLSEMHPDSFTAQKLFLINQLRRKYPLEKAAAPEEPIIRPTQPARPKMIPKLKK